MNAPEVGPHGPASGRFADGRPGRALSRLGLAWAVLAVTAGVAVIAVVVIAVVDGGEPEGGQGDQAEVALGQARARAVTIEGSVCGAAGPSVGSGIALDGDRVLTAAHVVASADRLEVVRSGERTEATIAAFDPLRDLAIIEPVAPLAAVPPLAAFGRLQRDDSATVVAAARSGDIDATVTMATVIEMDEVRGTRRSTRDGYLLRAETLPGDSGAGLYDGAGRLSGVLFAVSTDDGERTWATAAVEVEDFLGDGSVIGTFACDPARSKVVASG